MYNNFNKEHLSLSPSCRPRGAISTEVRNILGWLALWILGCSLYIAENDDPFDPAYVHCECRTLLDPNFFSYKL